MQSTHEHVHCGLQRFLPRDWKIRLCANEAVVALLNPVISCTFLEAVLKRIVVAPTTVAVAMWTTHVARFPGALATVAAE